jgi:hypothetical protein
MRTPPAIQMNVFPNPSSGNTRVRFRCEDRAKHLIQIFCSEGQLIREEVINVTGVEVMKQLKLNTPGIYLVKITNGNTSTAKKLIIH